jgi:uncharacterized membrane protein YbhN (UPF0104 family)
MSASTVRSDLAPSLPHQSALKRWLVLALKLLVAGGLLYYVFAYKVDAEDKERLNTILLKSPVIMALAIFTISMQLIIGAQRLRMLLIPQDVHLGLFQTIRLTYLGAFFDTFMITSIGGDAVKAWYLARQCPKEKRLGAVSVLILDRLLGLLGLLTLTVFMTIWNIQDLNADESIRPFVIWLFIVPALLMIGTLMLLSNRVRMWRPMQAILNTIPMGKTIDRAYDSLQRFRERPSILLLGWTLSLISHISGVLAGYILMIGLDQHADLGKFFVAWFISGFVTSFAPFGGIGTGQILYEQVFRSIVGLPPGMGVILATTTQITVLIAKSPGFLAWVLSRRHPVISKDTLVENNALKGTQP